MAARGTRGAPPDTIYPSRHLLKARPAPCCPIAKRRGCCRSLKARITSRFHTVDIASSWRMLWLVISGVCSTGCSSSAARMRSTAPAAMHRLFPQAMQPADLPNCSRRELRRHAANLVGAALLRANHVEGFIVSIDMRRLPNSSCVFRPTPSAGSSLRALVGSPSWGSRTIQSFDRSRSATRRAISAGASSGIGNTELTLISPST